MAKKRTPEEVDRSLRAQIAANTRWAIEPNRTQAMAPARAAFVKKFEKQVDPDGTMDPVVRAERVDNLMRAHMLKVAMKGAQARRKQQP